MKCWKEFKRYSIARNTFILFLLITCACLSAHIFLDSSSSSKARKLIYTPPKWCETLINHPRQMIMSNGTDRDCGRNRYDSICSDGLPRFFSQFNQDRFIYLNHFKYLHRPGTYVDIAANEPIRISNTYFFDACLGWEGACIEANPVYHDSLKALRRCKLIPTCVSNKVEKVKFILAYGSGGISETNKYSGKKELLNTTTDMTCIPSRNAFEVLSTQKVDLLSLDVEGHELKVLEGIDWKKVKINVIVMENNVVSAGAFLTKKQYRKIVTESTSDAIYLHSSVVWGKPE